MSAVLEARGVVKSFGHVQVLREVDFVAHAGEVTALIGDNGAGKSTLIKILSGALQRDAGEVLLDGEPVRMTSPTHARELGIETVYQDLALAPELGPAENAFAGRELLRPGLLGRLGLLDKRTMRARAAEAFTSMGTDVKDLDAPVGALSGGQRQSVAICRAVMWARRVVIMDEPTAALGVRQTGRVLDLVRRVAGTGVAVVLISHNMPEVLQVADRVQVLRLGRRVADLPARGATVEQLVGAMTGALDAQAGRPAPTPVAGPVPGSVAGSVPSSSAEVAR
ncbi:ATP-binding cassette domain-containing protein [Quadrisphaera sp. DSM 44207]|uniref:ATP-binding cassette domain-containing protein n=1 Tax=Quadrisphaera sp. DSM 44207 TaxID=1881057 RepID=UPI00088F3307|nr:ATP-binding cassette domain-containing protein [Quadrisphaera sp. DSM 44207]SDQ19370.1 monosaccharide ABC transporter ATP-binding protein, CUT2 family [Quadrisphaera sp. DSM 44207]